MSTSLRTLICLLAFLSFLLLPGILPANDAIDLMSSDQPFAGWKFDNGQEFPGATGKLELITEEGQPTLKLYGDFSKGGAYVQTLKTVDEVSTETVEFEIKVPPGVGKVTMRLIDGTGQCHQLDIRLNDKGGWQRYSLPLARYFSSLEAGAPMDIVTRYEKWSGANNGKWHQPLNLLVFLAGKEVMKEGSISVRNIHLVPTPHKTEVAAEMRLDDVSETETGSWNYNNGDEFQGAKGGLTPIVTEHGPGLALQADFSAGGRYVGVRRNIGTNGVKQTSMVRFQARSDQLKQYSVRLVDETGQCHQRGGLQFPADGKWHEVTLDPLKISGGEHWGGADDGQWHGALQLIEIMLSTGSAEKSPIKLELTDLHADVIIEAQESGMAWNCDFASSENWKTSGDVSVVKEGENSVLQLSRSLENLPTQTTATGPSFSVNPGTWKVSYRDQAKLHSPDNSFHAGVSLQVADGSGKLLELFPLGIRYGAADWADTEKMLSFPSGSAQAWLKVEMQKTYGTYQIDDISVARLEVQPPEPIVKDVRIASSAIGNLFLPDQPVEFQLTVNTAKPLAAAERVARMTVRDYRGNEVLTGINAPLTGSGNSYTGSVQLNGQQIQLNQFYELHVEVPQGVGGVFKEFAGFAILQEAASKQFAPEQIPFTIRNWDSRIRDYFFLADRLGLRMFGVWGGWQYQPPYKPQLPGLEYCEQLDAKWITGTPAADVERNGFKNVSEEALREGMKNFLNAYAQKGLAMIAMGNEPHGTGQVVLDNVRAYKAIYETVKAFDPEIHVIGTSVEPNEEYFRAGYQNYLDSYDFHVYEHYTSVRKAMQEYRELMKKYDAVKPIHSTELGLNSAGQARLTVAIELIKKCTVFFAEGGETVSWFTIQYPDTEGKARGQFGDAHCVFDCKFNNYNPRLDAIAYYNMINSLLEKKFVHEEQRPDGTQVYLFRNQSGQSLYVAWNDTQETAARLEIPEESRVEIIRIDGARDFKVSGPQGLTYDVGVEPVLVLFSN
ncbi:MAG: hypothetical protein KDA78_11895 [Planctomycetaceae bacterium]|nr:hypothetical protein [Planctomycetaceae bacterium]